MEFLIYKDHDRIGKPIGVNSSFLRICISLYLALSIYEFAFSTTMGSLLKYFGLLIMIIWFVLAYRQHITIHINKATMLLVLWLLVNIISLLWTKNFNIGYYYIMAIGNMICMLIVVQNIQWSSRSIKQLLYLYSVSATILSFLIIQNGDLYHGVGIRYTFTLFGFEMDPNGIVGFLAPVVIIMIHFLLQNSKMKIIFAIGICLCVFAIMLAASRGGILALFVGATVYLLLDTIWNKNRVGVNLKKRILFLIIIMIVSYFVTSQISNELLTRVFNFHGYVSDRGSDRLDLWDLALKYFSNSPFWGLGIASYSAITYRGVHNMYLSVLCDVGMASFIPFISALLSFNRSLFRQKNYLGLSILICMMFIIVFLDAYQKKIMWNILIIVAIMLNNSMKHRINPPIS